jgi:hypothetical protein
MLANYPPSARHQPPTGPTNRVLRWPLALPAQAPRTTWVTRAHQAAQTASTAPVAHGIPACTAAAATSEDPAFSATPGVPPSPPPGRGATSNSQRRPQSTTLRQQPTQEYRRNLTHPTLPSYALCEYVAGGADVGGETPKRNGSFTCAQQCTRTSGSATSTGKASVRSTAPTAASSGLSSAGTTGVNGT